MSIKMHARRQSSLTFSTEGSLKMIQKLLHVQKKDWKEEDFLFIYNLYHNKDQMYILEEETKKTYSTRLISTAKKQRRVSNLSFTRNTFSNEVRMGETRD